VKDCRSLPTDRKGQFVFVDEAQSVPSIFDAVQHLYDGDKTRWRFVVCRSSARKLRRIGANLLPGRSFYHRLFPLTLAEHPAAQPPVPYAVSPLPFAWGEGRKPERPFAASDLVTRLASGELPGVVAAPEPDWAELLRAFAFVHLEEEIRREALVKDWGAFVRFLQLAAAESGQLVNFAASRAVGLDLESVGKTSSSRLMGSVILTPRHPADASTNTANIRLNPDCSFPDRGITFDWHRTSLNIRDCQRADSVQDGTVL